MPGKDPQLQLRGEHYYFRMKIPADLRGYFGSAEIRKALGTRDLKEALKLLKSVQKDVQHRIAAARRLQSEGLIEDSATFQAALEPSSGEPTRELSYWSFIDYAIGRAGELFPGIDPQAMHLRLMLHRVARISVYDSITTVHRKHDWSSAGYSLLFTLMIAGQLEFHRVAEMAGMSRATVTAVVRTLEKDGLVQRTHSRRDKRTMLLGLTDKGSAAIASGFLAHHEAEKIWADRLTPPERETLIALLAKIAPPEVRPIFDPA